MWIINSYYIWFGRTITTLMKVFLSEGLFCGTCENCSDKLVSIKRLAKMIMEIARKKQSLKHIPDPMVVRGQNSDNSLIKKKLGWASSESIYDGCKNLYMDCRSSRIEEFNYSIICIIPIFHKDILSDVFLFELFFKEVLIYSL